MIYLASPYTHKYQNVQMARAHNTILVVRKLLELKINAYSPIAHWILCGEGSQIHGYEAFRAHDEEMISLCERFAVLKLDGWMDSIGIAKESRYARSQNKLIEAIDFYELMSGRFRPQLLGDWILKGET